MHVFEDTCIVEAVDDAYRAVPIGQPGARVLVTNGRTVRVHPIRIVETRKLKLIKR